MTSAEIAPSLKAIDHSEVAGLNHNAFEEVEVDYHWYHQVRFELFNDCAIFADILEDHLLSISDQRTNGVHSKIRKWKLMRVSNGAIYYRPCEDWMVTVDAPIANFKGRMSAKNFGMHCTFQLLMDLVEDRVEGVPLNLKKRVNDLKEDLLYRVENLENYCTSEGANDVFDALDSAGRY